MMLCIRRVWASAGAPDRSNRVREPPRAAEISCLPRKHFRNHWPGIVLQTLPSKHLRRLAWTVGAVGASGAWERSDGGDEAETSKAGPCSYAVREYWSLDQRGRSKDRRVDVVFAAAVTVVLGVGNRVLYKLALVPLKHYPFFLAQLATFGYVIVYFSVLYLRYRAGIVTDEMLSMPKAPFLAVGLLEALGAATGMAAGAILSGASIPVLSQTFLVWQILLSTIFLGRRYRVNQLLGCCLVAIGVIVTVASGSSAGHSLKEAGIFWSLLMIVSFSFQAADTVLKEVIFLDARQQLKGRSVDLFVVNSFGSAFQALFICLLLPFLSKLWGIPFGQLPNYLKDGAACFLNMGTLSNDQFNLHITLEFGWPQGVMVPRYSLCCLLLSTWVLTYHCCIFSRYLLLWCHPLHQLFQYQYLCMCSHCHYHTSVVQPRCLLALLPVPLFL